MNQLNSKSVQVRIDAALHQYIKIQAAQQQVTIKALVEKAFDWDTAKVKVGSKKILGRVTKKGR
jgi:predicted HicB family RNase H-like nuclease